MYKLEFDKTKKLIKLEVSGFIKLEEMQSILSELQNALKQFKLKEPFVLINAVGFKPASPEIQPLMKELQVQCISHCKKAATVTDNVIAQMQAKRLADETNANEVIMRFKSVEEAMQYLFG